jgi:hypothetical protein
MMAVNFVNKINKFLVRLAFESFLGSHVSLPAERLSVLSLCWAPRPHPRNGLIIDNRPENPHPEIPLLPLQVLTQSPGHLFDGEHEISLVINMVLTEKTVFN